MRRRLALQAAALASLIVVAFLIPLGLLVRTVAADRAVSAATSQAQSLIPVVATAGKATVQLTVEQLNAASAHPFTIFLPDGSVLGAAAERTEAVQLAARGRSFSVETRGGRQILVSVQDGSGRPAVISTFLPGAELSRGVTRSWLILLGLGIVLVAAGIAIADRLARTMVRATGSLSAVSHRLAEGDLGARALPAGPPEFREVAGGLNRLAARIRDLLREEREASADLAHRLRTPLMALRLDAEALRDTAEAGRISADIDNLERAVNQSIGDASRRGSGAPPAACDAADVVRERVSFWAILATETDRTVTASLHEGPLPVRLPRADLAACVDALLGNIFAHTPEGTGYAITLASRPGGGARLVVADHGPGFPAELAGGPLRRGASGAGSTGLGLDIARRTADASGGSLTLANTPDGAQLTLDLGPPAALLASC